METWDRRGHRRLLAVCGVLVLAAGLAAVLLPDQGHRWGVLLSRDCRTDRACTRVPRFVVSDQRTAARLGIAAVGVAVAVAGCVDAGRTRGRHRKTSGRACAACGVASLLLAAAYAGAVAIPDRLRTVWLEVGIGLPGHLPIGTFKAIAATSRRLPLRISLVAIGMAAWIIGTYLTRRHAGGSPDQGTDGTADLPAAARSEDV
jgi:hypothetical protein